jgi:hypothetical protein
MKKTVALLAGCILAVGHEEAQAVTFTPDMWVYEVPMDVTGFEADGVNGPYGGAPYIDITCTQNPGIDVIAAKGGLEQHAIRTRIGFNSSSIVCDQILTGCPENEQDIDAGSGFFYNIVLEASKGELSYCGYLQYATETACYSFSPGLVEISGAFKNIGSARGFWDYGFGGYWSSYAQGDFWLSYSGTGSLVSSPAVVPLPAPVLMLGSSLLAFGAFGVRNAGRRRRPHLH